jgi:hypothetical protein
LELPFEQDRFDLALSSHVLRWYSNHFPEAFGSILSELCFESHPIFPLRKEWSQHVELLGAILH